MTYAPHIRLQFGGSLFVTEQWSCSLNMRIGAQNVDPTSIVLDLWEQWTRDNIEDLAADVRTWHESAEARNSQAARLEYVKANVIGPDGRYRNPGETVGIFYTGTDRQPGSRTPGLAQDTVCVSLLTDVTRGRASRGRFYPPTGQMTPDAQTGRISAGEVEGVVLGAQQLLDNLANQPGIDANNPRVVVASELGSPGPQRDVTSVAVGNVVDTQRRRRKDLPEAYTSLPVTIR